MKSRKTLGIAIGAVSFVAGGAIFSSLSALADSGSNLEEVPIEVPTQGITLDDLAAEFGMSVEDLVKTNDAGQTYGTALVEGVEGTETPDLVLVVMDDGKEGYVYSSELRGPVPSSPEEAVQIAEEQEAAAARGERTQLTAYDYQGNPIGTFTLDG